MWHNLPFSQRSKATNRALGVNIGGDKVRGWTKFVKRGLGNTRGIRNPLSTMNVFPLVTVNKFLV